MQGANTPRQLTQRQRDRRAWLRTAIVLWLVTIGLSFAFGWLAQHTLVWYMLVAAVWTFLALAFTFVASLAASQVFFEHLPRRDSGEAF